MSVLLVRDNGTFLRASGYTRISYDPRILVSRHPVEQGAEVSDHAQPEPLSFVIVDFTVGSLSADPANLGGGAAAVDAALTFFEAIGSELITVEAGRDGRFTSCQLVAWPHDQTAEGARIFQPAFQQVRIANAINVAIPARIPAPVAETTMPDEVDMGPQPTTSLPVDGPAPDVSALKALQSARAGWSGQ